MVVRGVVSKWNFQGMSNASVLSCLAEVRDGSLGGAELSVGLRQTFASELETELLKRGVPYRVTIH